MKNKASFDIEEIKAKLIECCISCDASEFLPYLLSSSVDVGFPNKIRFFGCLKSILKSARKESKGVLELRIEEELWEEDEELKSFNFYDQVHKYPRINLQVKIREDSLFINILPF